MRYCESTFQTIRRKTREVKVGKIGVGGDNPVRIQSMTTSNTRDVEATIEQIIRLADSGCEIARLTVQGIKEAEACEGIKNGLIKRGYEIPIVADIHFYPPAAMRVVDFVDKVRINPGNFVDKRALFIKKEYDDASYREEIQKIEEGFATLVLKCKELKRAMRIGTNHGSLSDRIMNRYGDSPFGMVESALEFARVCRQYDYHDFLFSMKASNPVIMMQAYRLLVAEMMKLGWDYPLHLGVTEAGEGEDGRVKSAMGIGALLLDGIGDTVRVSLTEDPWAEIDPCKRLIQFAQRSEKKGVQPFVEKHRDVSAIVRRKTEKVPTLHPNGSVILKATLEQLLSPTFFTEIGCTLQFGKPQKGLGTADAVFLDAIPNDPRIQEVIGTLQALNIAILCRTQTNLPRVLPVRTLKEARNDGPFVLLVQDDEPSTWDPIASLTPEFILFAPTQSPLHQGRRLFDWLQQKQLKTVVIHHFTYACSSEDLVIHAAAECGALLADALGEGICLDVKGDLTLVRSLSFNILQAARLRTSKTEYISCPGCGRTLFELQTVSRRIREKTSHLPGVKIAIMGCIVNGPGEMADADFGYVGSKAGKVDLYVGKTCVERNIDFSDADDRLIQLIKSHGKWVDSPSLIVPMPV